VSELPSFVRPLADGLHASDEPTELPPDLQAEVDRRCEEIRQARACAEVSSRDYLVC
jgi:hypothetical protein